MNILWIGLGSIDRAATGPIIWTTFLSWSTKPLIVHTFRLICIFTCLYEMYRVYSLTCCEILLRTKYKPLLLSLMLLCAVLKRVPILSYVHRDLFDFLGPYFGWKGPYWVPTGVNICLTKSETIYPPIWGSLQLSETVLNPNILTVSEML